MRSIGLRVLAAALLVALISPLSVRAATMIESPMANTRSGAVRGVWLLSDAASFKGVPFAAPPVGDLRWKPPAPIARWSGIRDASHYAPTCMQADEEWNHADATRGSEDCLYLNIWTPTLASTARLPVLVFIHGGGLQGGSATFSDVGGEALVKRGIVVVMIPYRLGVFGYLAHRELSQESTNGVSGNYGLLDQIAALKWVRDNIASFGGNPARITIGGQSAGGFSVINLMVSPLSKNISTGAIISSGAVLSGDLSGTPIGLHDAERVGERFAGGLSINELRSLPAEAILKRSTEFIKTERDSIIWRPIIDGVVLTRPPMTAFSEGSEAKIPLLIGSNSRELSDVPDTDVAKIIRATYGANADAALHEYGLDKPHPPSPDPLMGGVGAEWRTDTTLRCGAAITARRHTAAGATTYEYQFEQAPPGRPDVGSTHGLDGPYALGTLTSGNPYDGRPYTKADFTLSDIMMAYWTNFVKTGDPNGPRVPLWPEYGSRDGAYVKIATAYPGGVSIAHALRAKACALYEKTLVPQAP